MIVPLTLLVLLGAYFAAADCVYDMGYPEELSMDVPPRRSARTTLTLLVRAGANIPCDELCRQSAWCLGSSGCSLTTDKTRLGIGIDVDLMAVPVMFEAGGTVFEVVAFGLDPAPYGAKDGEIINPALLGADESGCLLAPNRTGPPPTAELYGPYFAAGPGVAWVWWNEYQVDDPYRRTESRNRWANYGVSPPAGGRPITGLLMNTINKIHADDFAHFRTRHLPSCALPIPEEPVTDMYMFADDRFAHITIPGKKYLACWWPGSGGAGCTWEDSPGVLWRVSDFNTAVPGSDHAFWKYERSLFAHSVGGSHEELGWLTRGVCDKEAEGTFDNKATRIQKGGKFLDSNDVQCGAKGWKFVRDHNYGRWRDGSFLCHSVDGPNDGCIAAHPAHDRVEVCSVRYGSTGNECLEGGHVGVWEVRLEQAFLPSGGLAFRLNHGDDLWVKCGTPLTSGAECVWMRGRAGSSVFKYLHRGVGDSWDNPHSPPIAFREQAIDVYNEQGGFYALAGRLKPMGDLLRVASPGDGHPWTIVEKSSGAFQIWSVSNNGQLDNKAFAQPSVEGELFRLHTSSETPLAIQASHRITARHDGQHYSWHTGQCPDGTYAHQIYCRSDNKCDEWLVGCVRHPHCKTEGSVTTVTLESNKFGGCPPGQVLVTRRQNTIGCRKLIDTSDTGNFNISDIGAGVEGALVATGRQIGVGGEISVGNWEGTPFKALAWTTGGDIMGWSLTNTCYRDWGPGMYNMRTVNRHGADMAATCTGSGEFVGAVVCSEENCAEGLQTACITAKGCRPAGGTVVVKDDTSCPPGKVLVGIQCMGPDVYKPCGKIELLCKELIMDSSWDPAPAGGGGGGADSDSPSEIAGIPRELVIGLATGIPLLVIAALVCLCCVPESVADK